jgi:hypothetical protein
MQKIFWVLFLIILPLKVQAGTSEEGEFNEEETLSQEVASEETSKKEFGQLVKSTMELMGPSLELTQNVDSPATTAQE